MFLSHKVVPTERKKIVNQIATHHSKILPQPFLSYNNLPSVLFDLLWIEYIYVNTEKQGGTPTWNPFFLQDKIHHNYLNLIL